MRAAYRPTAALTRLVVAGVVPLAVAVVVGRPSLVLVGAPFVLAAALILARRPPAAVPEVEAEAPGEPAIEGRAWAWPVTVGTDERLDLAVVRVRHGSGVSVARADRLPALAVPAGGVRTTLTAHLDRWGRRTLGPLSVTGYAADLCLRSEEHTGAAVDLRVLPETEPFSADDAMPRAAGLTGPHRSRRTGEGGELAGIRAYAPGDRLRRIDWRATVRTGEPHVAETLSDRDADLVVVLDVLHDLATDPDSGGQSVLDVAVHAAAGIAGHYLDAGDRVALMEVGSASRVLRPLSGRRHEATVLDWLLEVQPYRGRLDTPDLLPALALMPSSALVVVLTPLLDERMAAITARLARSGRSVVAVDTLPPEVRPDSTGDWAALALRLALVERRTTVARLLEHGVPTVAWEGAGTLDTVLRDASRVAAAPTLAGRR